MPYFEYGEMEVQYLKNRDPVLGKVIDQIGHVYREITPDLFAALVRSIVGQQISTKAADTIWNRMRDSFEVTPQAIVAMGAETVQKFGITHKKAGYILELAEKVVSGEFDVEALAEKSDEEVCTELCRLSGIGVWTAEMLMTFSMQRPNIMSYGDLALHRGLRMLYHHREINRKLFEKYRRRYAPYATVACLYLWEIAGGTYEGFRDCAPKNKKKRQ